MTDYLQLLEEETAPALLEQARRLERALSGTAAEPWEEGEASASPGGSEGPGKAAGETGKEEARREGTSPENRTPALSQAQAQREAREDFPLLEQLERLEQAEDGLPWERTRAREIRQMPARMLERAERGGLTPGSGAGMPPWADLSRAGREPASPAEGREALQPLGGLTWAEQADRAFRRDSRRYDGGFYLY